MAIFAKKKTEKAASKKETAKVPALKPAATKAVAVPAGEKIAKPLFTITPHVTEKAHFHAEKLNSYTFKVVGNSNKKSIAHAIETTYKVVPVHIRIINTADRRVSYRGRINHKSGFKKAYVTLKKGDKIEIA